jgi:ATPase family associated with various cellular activities (AAA)
MSTTDWQIANQRLLTAALDVVRARLEERDPAEAERAVTEATAGLPARSALDGISAGFGLTPFERDLLLLCAGPELDATFPLRAPATFGLALAVLPDAHWTALAPAGPLRRWRLLEVGAGETLAAAPLRIDERALHYLTGVSYADERLQGLLEPLDEPGELPPSQLAAAERVAAALSASPLPALQLGGRDAIAARTVAAAACAALGARAWALAAVDIPAAAAERTALARLWEREAVLEAGALLVECTELESAEELRPAAALADAVQGAVLVSGDAPLRTRRRSVVRLDPPRPSAQERRGLWSSALGTEAGAINGRLEALADQFQLGAQEIRTAAATAVRLGADELGDALWEACRAQSRPGLDALAQRIEPAATWDDLVLPQRELATLRELATHVRRRAKVYDEWGFGGRGDRGLGVSALFAGASGTGKTMAGEVLANELRLDLYRIDLSQVVSKYIGETEKNLRRVFDAAESGGAILLFDEADALFGKRTEVKDSHDRYANIEVSYLLQRMEAYRGLAVLTTNMKEAIDGAFLRRLRFVVQFPFPDATQRAEIWRRIFPAATPTDGLDAQALARLSVAGGSIRSIALNAAFLAADADEPVGMAHVARAARTEYAKLEKPLIESEVGAWA